MPLTASGQEVLKDFKERYGERGEEVFYRSLRAGTLPAKLESDQLENLGEYAPDQTTTGAAGRTVRGLSTTGLDQEEHPRTQTGGEPAPLSELPASMVARELGGRGDTGYGARDPLAQQDDLYDLGGAQTEDQGEIGTLPGGAPEMLEHPQEHPGTSAPPQSFDVNPALRPAYGTKDAVGYGGIAGGIHEQPEFTDDAGFFDQMPSGMSQQEIFDVGRSFWQQWQPKR